MVRPIHKVVKDFRLPLRSKHEQGVPHQEDPRAAPIDTKVASHPSIVAISEESPLSAAFARAYLSRTDDEKIALGKTQSLRDLFAKLDSTNTKSKEQSRFRRGVEILQPTLQMLGSSMNLASPLAALDPIASNAFGIVQSVVKVIYSLWHVRHSADDLMTDCDRNLWSRNRIPGACCNHS